MKRFSPVVRALPFALLGLVVGIGCNGLLGNEEGTAQPASSADATTDDPTGDAGQSCDTTQGNKVCFGLCVKIDQPNTGCGETSCAACDPKNAKATACKGGSSTIACSYTDCKAGFDNCDGTPQNGCEASLGAKQTCGDCNTKCGGMKPLCSMDANGKAACVGACPANQSECDGSCVTFDTIQNCGSCGTKCERASASATCDPASGTCNYTCNAGTHACGQSCEGDLDPTFCGPSCELCAPPAAKLNLVATCVAGGCGTTCAKGYRDCDLDPSNGCEVAGLCPPRNCTEIPCPKFQQCCEGVCRPSGMLCPLQF